MSSKLNDGQTMLTRRNALKVGAGAGAAALGMSSVTPPAVRPVQDSEALAFTTAATVYAAAVAGGMAVGWAVREYEVLGADDVPDGLGPVTLRDAIWRAAKKRESNNATTITDNSNIVNYMDEAIYSEGKLKAIDAIKQGYTKDNVINAGLGAAREQMAVIEKNLIKSYNAAINEYANAYDKVVSHDDLAPDEVLEITTVDDSNKFDYIDGYLKNNYTYTLRNEATIDAHVATTNFSGNVSKWHMFHDREWGVKVYTSSNQDGDQSDNLMFNNKAHWPLWSSMQTEFDNIENNISVWVDNVYDKVKTGEISPDEYLSAYDIANSVSAEDDRALAIADLISMNIPGDYGTPITIELIDDNTRLQGYLAATDPGDNANLSEGVTIDPTATTGSWYFAYLPKTAISTIPTSQYNLEYGIQGGKFKLWTDPRNTTEGFDVSENLTYHVDTTHGETAEVDPNEFNATTNSSGGTVYEADISDRLNQTITDIGRIRAVGENQPDKYQTLNLDQPFKIVGIDGDTSITLQQNRDPQTDTNYISDEEWQTLLDQQERLIEEYEDATSPSGGGWSPSFDIPTVGPLDSVEDWGVATIGAIVGSMILGNLGS